MECRPQTSILYTSVYFTKFTEYIQYTVAVLTFTQGFLSAKYKKCYCKKKFSEISGWDQSLKVKTFSFGIKELVLNMVKRTRYFL